jgi:hypothetical protein
MHTSHFDIPLNTQKNIVWSNIWVSITTSCNGKNQRFLDLKTKCKQTLPSNRKKKPWESSNGDLLQNIEKNETKQDAKCPIT